ncbi:MAG: hypothetical protein AAF645_21890 [Myxococcota bacterium]
MLRLFLGFFAFAAWATPTLAHAQSEAEQAEALFLQGAAEIERGDFEAAHGLFREGYLLSHRPLFLINMAECSRLLGNEARAISQYRRYLELAPNGPAAADAQAALEELGAPYEPTPEQTVPTPEEVATQAVEPAPPPERRPAYRHPALWVSVAVVVVAAVTLGIVLATRSDGTTSPCGVDCFQVDVRTPGLP